MFAINCIIESLAGPEACHKISSSFTDLPKTYLPQPFLKLRHAYTVKAQKLKLWHSFIFSPLFWRVGYLFLPFPGLDYFSNDDGDDDDAKQQRQRLYLFFGGTF